MSKDNRFTQAVIELKKMVEENSFGSIQFNFQNGLLVNFKKELTGKFIDDSEKAK